jgi:hypothetical protein
VQNLKRRPEPDAQLLADPSHRNPVPIMEKDQLGDELIAKQTFAQDAGGPSLNGFPAAGAIFPLQAAEDTLGPHGPRIDEGALPKAFLLQRAAAVGTSGGVHADFLDTVGVVVVYPLAAVTGVTALGAALFRSLLFGGVRLEGAAGRRRGGAKRPLLSSALAVVQLLPQAANFLLQLIDATLFLEALGTMIHTHAESSGAEGCV